MDCENKKEIPPEKVSFFKKWSPVFVLSLALAIIIIDTTLLNVSFSTLIKDLHTDIQSLQWVITAYSLTLAALTITGGRLGDLFGRKKMFILGAAIFAIGSFITSISHTVGVMIAGESIIEGVGAALMMPATASLLVSLYRGKDRAIAMGVWGGVAAASSAIGPILGGYLTIHYSWRWGFRINVFVAALLILGSIIIKECRDREEKPSLDFFGVLLSSTGLLSVVFGIIESSKYGWWHAKESFMAAGHVIGVSNFSIVPLSILVGLILLAFFFLWESHVAKTDKTPLISLKIFHNQQFAAGLAVVMVLAIGQAGLIFSIPVFFQAVRGLDAFHTGLAFLPMSIAALLMAPTSAIFSRKFPPKYLVQAGFLLAVIGLLIVRHTMSVDATTAQFIPGMILYGMGLGLTMAPISNITLSAVSVEEAGEASGINNTIRQLGASLGSAVIGAALLTALSTNLVNGINASKIIPNQAKAQIASQVAAQTSNVEFGGGAQLSAQVSPVMAQEITKISHQATTDSNKLALLYTIIFTGLGVIVSFALPKSKNIERNQSAAARH